jgi:hypothetical protein
MCRSELLGASALQSQKLRAYEQAFRTCRARWLAQGRRPSGVVGDGRGSGSAHTGAGGDAASARCCAMASAVARFAERRWRRLGLVAHGNGGYLSPLPAVFAQAFDLSAQAPYFGRKRDYDHGFARPIPGSAQP